MTRPSGVTIVAAIFGVAAAYLLVVAAIMLASPGSLSMAAGSELMGGLELGGPYMFLLVGAVGIAIGAGLLRLNNWARRAAILLAMVGIVQVIPAVSGSLIAIRFAGLAWGGLRIMVRVIIVWYLYQRPVKETFENPLKP
jgi:hypothetical protein